MALSLLMAMAPSAHGILFFDTGAANHNITAPTGGYANSGWQYEGYFGSYLGTMISPTMFITAQHIGVNSATFSYDTIFSGAPTVNYSINTGANGGQGFWDIAGTDLRIYQITGGTFAAYAPVYSGSADLTAAFVDMGRGGPRGADVMFNTTLKGFSTTGSDGVARWGRNSFTGSVLSNAGNLLVSDFDPVSNQDEFTLSIGDSGGGAFINVGGVWVLAGINYGVENGPFSTSPAGSNPFSAALFDTSGYFEQNGSNWIAVTGPTSLYFSRVSDSAQQIQNIVNVPEPSGAFLLCSAALVLLLRGRRTVAGSL
ncbi:MAG: hypothetical protein WCN98_02845 [Verrucomicrobiaceae bacterium]